MNDGVDFITLNRYIPGTRPDVFKTPQYKRNLQLHQMVQAIPNEINRLMFKELKTCEGHPESVYTRYAITVGEFATSKILSNKLRRDRKKKPSEASKNDSDADEDFIDEENES